MLSILVSVALSQAATTPASVPDVPVEVVGPQQPRRICRIERNTGSRVQARRICQTVQEQESERDENQRDVSNNLSRQWERDWVGRIGQPGPRAWGPNMGRAGR